MTFLALPAVANAIGIWGGGGAAELLASVNWLASCRLFYWGDLDVHGFHILSRLRRTFPNLASLMMDAATLEQFHSHTSRAKVANYEDAKVLTAEEQSAYERVRKEILLLEQEKIPYAHATRLIAEALSDKPTS